jgi:hypothetical protein
MVISGIRCRFFLHLFVVVNPIKYSKPAFQTVFEGVLLFFLAIHVFVRYAIGGPICPGGSSQ